ncbi:MAG: hypothetical protein P8X55_20880 [Desulfosarcinaceae bacterium]
MAKTGYSPPKGTGSRFGGMTTALLVIKRKGEGFGENVLFL